MSLFDRLKKKPEAAKAPTDKKPAKKKAEAPVSAPTMTPSARLHLSNALLRKPHVSEKAARLADKGTYVFHVAPSAEKVSIRKAVEALYGVKVDAVRIVKLKGKPVRRGRRLSHRSGLKKALVTLKKGQTIALYEGV